MSTWQLGILFSAFMSGVAVATLLECNYVHVVWLCLLALITAVYRSRTSDRFVRSVLLVGTLCIVLFAIGILRTEWHERQFIPSDLQQLVGDDVTLMGIVSKEPDVRDRLQMLSLQYEDRQLLVSTDKSVNISYGDDLQVTGILEVPENFETDLGRIFNYQNYLKVKGIQYRISFAEVEVLSSDNKSIFVTTLLTIKHNFMDQLDQVLVEPAGSLADGLLLGVDKGLGDQLEEDFRKSGIIHIVVLSGYNVMLVVVFVMFTLSFFMRSKWKLLFGLLSILAFVLLVGMSATVVRAGVMASLLLIAQTLHRTYDVMRALLFAGFIMVLINPYILLYDIGFQLSFMATVGIILALPFFAHPEQPETIGFNLRGYIISTIATQLTVLPLLIYHIGEVSLVAVIVNVLVLPVVPIAMFLSFLVGVTHIFSPTLATVIGYPTQFVLEYVIYVAELFANIPFATMTLPEISVWWIGVLYAALAAGYYAVINPSVFRRNVNDFSDWTIVEETENDTDNMPVSSTEVPKIFR